MSAGYERIVVTGGAGFIGSHVAEALVRRGAQLTLVDNFDPYYAPPAKRANLEAVRRVGSIEFREADIRDTAAMRSVFAAARPQAVIHLAARPGVRPSFAARELYEQINVVATRHLLACARDSGAGQFVFGSSSSVYGDSSRRPFSEEQTDLQPISPYACTKLAAEQVAREIAARDGLPVVCLRFFTVYGARQRPDLAIHKFTALIEAGRPVPVFGDGSSGRDYTYIDDIVAGVLAALEYSPARAPGEAPFEIFNLGNANPVRLDELVARLEAATGKRAVRDPQPAQPGDVALTWADISKAWRLLGYRPETRLEQGLERFVAWYRGAAAERTMAVGA